ncbi:transcriptional regulator [Actinopolyspora mortivallis]|uniref:MarR family transcriptional regulator n=1 Tax=Actinopolyspora mortivallis TaxID=33906 RepID=A0A2T0GSF3_ACTMO|nr:transcriptional regulator [Actinopolyspora mortivallis]PRW62046.1 MarR family transcriptional regulator [Actinopolyspora mortivallis]
MIEAVFDEVIHPSNRLQICAMLAEGGSWEFATVRDELGLSDSVLSKQVKVLRESGYVTVTKSPRNPRSRTWLALTAEGRRALEGHLTVLRRMAERSSPARTRENEQ